MKVMTLWCLSYERNWGTRLERTFEEVFFDYKPSKKECVEYLKKHGHPQAEVSWFDYGPIDLYQSSISIREKRDPI